MHPRVNKYNCPLCHLEHHTSDSRCPNTKDLIPAVFRMQGRTLGGKYQIGTIIGEGGMGILYSGEQIAVKRKVAVKFLFPQARLRKKAVERFQNEARLAASVSHRNIVEVFDMGNTMEMIPYIVMEYLDGDILADIIEQEPLAMAMAVDITMGILSGLNAVHSKGIIHRDLKPGNVFIAEQAGGEQTVKIFDFGVSNVARSLEVKTVAVSIAGMVSGTPKYMSPEMARGKRHVNHKTDLYSAGVILYEMVTGRFPFSGRNYNELVANIATKEPVPPHVFNPLVSGGFEDIILKAIEKDPGRRFLNAAEFAAHLSNFQTLHDDKGIPSLITRLPEETRAKIREESAQKAGTSHSEYREDALEKKMAAIDPLLDEISSGEILTKEIPSDEIRIELTYPGPSSPQPDDSGDAFPFEHKRSAEKKKSDE